MPGTGTSAVEVTHVSSRGVWVFVDDRELFLPYDQFPWFLNARIAAVLRVERAAPDRLRWPELDVDLTIASIEHPGRYPLMARDSASHDDVPGNVACDFLRRFARFEFALKRCGFVRPFRGQSSRPRDRHPVVEWERFAHEHEDECDFDVEFGKRVDPILDRPPAQQFIDTRGELDWNEEEVPGEITLEWLLRMTYRIRNNLFHGGKHPWNPERDIPLLKAAMEVIERAVHLNPNVCKEYRQAA